MPETPPNPQRPRKPVTQEQLAKALALCDPKAYAEYEILIREVAKDQERARCEGSLLEFFKRAWREIDKAPFVSNWHFERMCDALESLVDGQTRDLIVNIPPRHGKSLLVSVVFPAWVWCRSSISALSGPQVSFLAVSYSARLAENNAQKMLWLIEGHWYRSLWGYERIENGKVVYPGVQVRPDQASRIDFGNTAGGERYSASIEGGLIGRGGDIQLVDDPHSILGAESETQREATMHAFTESLPTRIRDPRTSARVLIMQRLHEGDATGWALENWNDPMHLMYPRRFDPGRAAWGDPRSEPGELIWPSFWSDAAYGRLKLSGYAEAGQFEQQPVPRGGGIFKREWFQPWPPMELDGSRLMEGWVMRDSLGRRVIKYPALEYVIATVDCAFTEKEENDPSAMLVMGVWRSEGKGRIERRGDTYVRMPDEVGYPKIMIIAGWTKRLLLHGPPTARPEGVSEKEWNSPLFFNQRSETWGLVEWVRHTCKRYKVDHLRIEFQGGGAHLGQELHRLHADDDWGVEIAPTTKHDKWMRANAVEHLVSSHQVYVPQFEDGTYPAWLQPIVDELCIFPKGKHDDAVDCFTAGLSELRQRGVLERPEEYDEAEEDLMNYERMRPVTGLPYPL